jgi:DHA2 family multidrug resistance protein
VALAVPDQPAAGRDRLGAGVDLRRHRQAEPSLLKGIDILGFALMALFLGSVEYVMEEGPRWDWLDDDAVRTVAMIGAVAGIGFFWRMFSYKNPIVDLRAFTDRNFALGCLYSFIIGVGLYGIVYIMPLFLANIRGYNALQIGEVMFVTGVFQFLSAPIAGASPRCWTRAPC